MPSSKKKQTVAPDSAELSPSLVAELERRVNQFRSAVQKSLVDDGLGENVLGEMSDSGSEIDWEAEERKADLEEAGSRESTSTTQALVTLLQISNRQGTSDKKQESSATGSKSGLTGKADSRKSEKNQEMDESDAEGQRKAKKRAKKEKKEKAEVGANEESDGSDSEDDDRQTKKRSKQEEKDVNEKKKEKKEKKKVKKERKEEKKEKKDKKDKKDKKEGKCLKGGERAGVIQFSTAAPALNSKKKQADQ